MTSIDLFLAERTQLCERQHARITPKQCHICQAREDAFCVGCKGLTPTYPLSVLHEDDMGKKVAACVMCHRTMEISGRGMCGKCYAVELKREKSAKDAPALKPMKSTFVDHEFFTAPLVAHPTINAPQSIYPTPELAARKDNPLLKQPVTDLYLVVFPKDISEMLFTQDVEPGHIIDLVRLGLDGKIQELA